MKRLTTTENIEPGSMLRAYKRHFGYAILQSICANSYFLAALCDNDMFFKLAVNDIVEIYLWIEDEASYEFGLRVIAKTDTEHKIVFFANTEDITWNRGRQCLEAVVNIPVDFFTFPSKTGKVITAEKIVTHSGQILLLGDREAVIRSSVELEQGVFLKGNFIAADVEIEILGKIEWLNPEKKIYNIIFAGMDRETDKILEYVFETYREE